MTATENNKDSFYIAKYTINLKAKTSITLPPYKGATLRGAFGSVLRKLCCVLKKTSCNNCLISSKCVYKYIFETSPPANSIKLRKITEIPHPFVIEPPEEKKDKYLPEEILHFDLILFGNATQYLPYFILVFKELGKIGLGKDKGKYELTSIKDINQNLIYSSHDDTIRNINYKIYCNEITNYAQKLTNTKYLQLSFITPTRIKYQNDLIVKPQFHNIIRALLHRLSTISYFYWNTELNLNYNDLIQQSKNIIIKQENLTWYDWERYSTRQKTKMKLGGFIGDIVFQGNFIPFLTLLLLGEYTHIGKNCTFGLGKYKILKYND